MAADRITIDRSSPNTATEATEFVQLIRDLRSVYERLERTTAKMNHCFDAGPPADFTKLETLWGVPAGSGQTVFNLTNGSRGVMNGEFQNNNVIELTERVG